MNITKKNFQIQKLAESIKKANLCIYKNRLRIEKSRRIHQNGEYIILLHSRMQTFFFIRQSVELNLLN